MNPLYTVAEIRTIERTAAAALPPGALMQRAGQSSANAALDLLPITIAQARVLVLAGPGDNGGDALEAAAHLSFTGAQVTLIHHAPPNANAASAERKAALARAQSSDARFREAEDANIAGTEWDLVIDGLFGIGLKRPIGGALRTLVEAINQLRCSVLALDVPSGLDADTGCVVGPGGVAIRATHTVTFIGNKPGLHTCDGRDYAGLVDIARLEIDASHYMPASLHLNDVKFFSRHLRARRHNSHKGSYGNVAVIGGARGMSGAPILASRAAINSGAGRVYTLFVEDPLAADPGQPELMCRAAQDFDLSQATLVIGPGLGNSAAARDLLADAIACGSALLADADALNLLAGDAALQSALAQRSAAVVITPHPLEAARLLGSSIGAVQADRLSAARTLAARLHAVVVLKGSGTIIAAPDGQAVINTTGNPALATAGTGDVLAGVCGALLAQGWPQWEAALAAVWLHGMAADVLVTEGIGPIGLTAGELIPAIRTALNRMIHHQAR
ncbi:MULTISPECIES: NAD(P)H-hydrate dehydratase [unclassified Duganella]|uniref:NAD(P)H-hydrate dehydratase n=1 Tax=unclassified Duganella TaxID=2636909 RepID=UPI00088D41A8|nr:MULTISPECIES: NAD(P)H-hydrate dehydratase [unclassified Duganella]SDG80426.1 yjeF C-terminal region, hydroxyethylthiazole kinase-related/yjeF N-terminal region [Duganella sp. OV458]SDK07633.1 yjeF C-terminal region, hydroxyethylthiazole kinase-related/yjeF N-terminal region [Duganella sp. OV510]